MRSQSASFATTTFLASSYGFYFYFWHIAKGRARTQ
jgi:hypothetical protein